MRIRFVPLMILVCLLVLATAAYAESPDRKFRVGVIIPLSGQVASLGAYTRNGINLAYEMLPESSREKIELVFEDDQFDPAKTLSAYRKLRSSGPVDAVIVWASPPANGLGPVTEREKVILIAVAASDPTIAVGKKYSFIHWVTPPVLGEALGDEFKRRDFKRIAFVCAEVTGAIADIEAAKEALKSRGMAQRIVYSQTFMKNETDYRTAIAQLKQLKVDAVVAGLFPGALSSFAKQLKVAGVTAELVGMETFEDAAEVKAADGAMLGAWYVNASDSTGDFVESYKKRFGEHPGFAAANAFDTLNLIAGAADKAGIDNEGVRAYLQTIKDFRGATGVFSSSGDNRFTLPAALKRVTENGFEPYRG